MFLKSLKVRIAGLFTILVLGGTILLFQVSFLSLRSLLIQNDQDDIRTILLRYWSEYHTAGLDRPVGSYASVKNPYIVRILSPEGVTYFADGTLFLEGSDAKREELIVTLDQLPIPSDGFTRIEPKQGGTAIEGASVALRDGNILQAGITTRIRDSALKSYRRIFLIAAIPFLAFAFVGGWAISVRTTQPVNRLIDSARSIIETGQLSDRIGTNNRGDELDTLVNLYNDMLAKIETGVDGMRGALDSVAHELRTPLTRFRNNAELALSGSSNEEELRNALSSALDESAMMTSTLRTLMDISEAETGVMQLDRTLCDLDEVVRSAFELYEHVADERNIAVDMSGIQPVQAEMDTTRVRQAVANLIDNAIKYTPAGGSIKIGCYANEGSAVVSVSDTGIGIAPHEISQVWNRLSRGQRAKEYPGQGLGLSLIKAIVEAHNGSVTAVSEIDKGSTFTLLFPATS